MYSGLLSAHSLPRSPAVVASAEVPHVPSNAVLFQHGADIVQPSRAVVRIGNFAVHAEFVTGERHIPVLCPFRCLSDLNTDAVRIPVVKPISQHSNRLTGSGSEAATFSAVSML